VLPFHYIEFATPISISPVINDLLRRKSQDLSTIDFTGQHRLSLVLGKK
jgi:hypothetical protein